MKDRELLLHWDRRLWLPSKPEDEDLAARIRAYSGALAAQQNILGNHWRAIISDNFPLERVLELRPAKVCMVIDDKKLDGPWYFTLRNISLHNQFEVRRHDGRWPRNVTDRFNAGIELSRRGIAAHLAHEAMDLQDVISGGAGIHFVPQSAHSRM
jgi:hypothetical protein